MMVSVLARKSGSLYSRHFVSRTFNLCFKYLSTIPNKDVDTDADASPSEYSSSLNLSPFLFNLNHPSTGFDIELVDHDVWEVSSGIAQASREVSAKEAPDEYVEGELDFEDDIDNMRVRGNLFYKLERTSKEFEEYNLDFHGKKSSMKKEVVNKAKTTPPDVASKYDKLPRVDELTSRVDEDEFNHVNNKRQRNPTFNQLTGPYHEPFCLDIFISKASVRACIVHRVTSKVVAVAHSISKDIKFDLTSTKNNTTCAAVGAILAQRALADDIHDLVYTPRRQERLEGKLQIVLQSLIHNGINVKVKIKHRPRK